MSCEVIGHVSYGLVLYPNLSFLSRVEALFKNTIEILSSVVPNEDN